MDYTKLRLENEIASLELPLFGLQPDYPYICKGVDGLGPPEVDVFIANTIDLGGVYQDRQPREREVVLLVGLNPNYGINQTPGQMRDYIYRLFGARTSVLKLLVQNGSETLVYTTCHIKRIEPAIFSKEPAIQITLVSPKTYLYALNETSLSPAQLDKTVLNLDNPGTAACGFRMNFKFTAAVTNWTLTNALDNTKITLNGTMASGTEVIIDTRPGVRTLKTIVSGATKNRIDILSTDSSWLELRPELNSFLTSNQNFEWLGIQFLPQYWGV